MRSLTFVAVLMCVIGGNTVAVEGTAGTADDVGAKVRSSGAPGCEEITEEFARNLCVKAMQEREGSQDCASVEWTVSDTIDEMTDAKKCAVYTSSGLLGTSGSLMFFSMGGKSSFSVMGDEYPGERSSIRIDSNKVKSFDGQTPSPMTAQILKEIRSGKVIRTRYVKWPDGTFVDRAMPVCDLPQKIDSCSKRKK